MATLRMAYTYENIGTFTRGLLTGGTSLEPIPGVIKFQKVDKWDGEDAPV